MCLKVYHGTILAISLSILFCICFRSRTTIFKKIHCKWGHCKHFYIKKHKKLFSNGIPNVLLWNELDPTWLIISYTTWIAKCNSNILKQPAIGYFTIDYDVMLWRYWLLACFQMENWIRSFIISHGYHLITDFELRVI